MKKLITVLLFICMLLCGKVYAANDTVLTGIINEVYITDSMGDKIQCLILSLDEETTFNVYDDMGDQANVKTKEIQLTSKDYSSDMNGKKVTVKGNDFYQGLTYYHIRPITLLNAKITLSETKKETYPAYVTAYAGFIQKALTVNDGTFNSDNRISELQLIDLDFNSVPELIIFDGGAGGSVGINIVSIVDGEAKLRYGSSYFSDSAFEKDKAIAYTDNKGTIVGQRFENSTGEFLDNFEMRRTDGTGELFWYLKSTNYAGEDGYQCSAYKFSKNNKLTVDSISSTPYLAGWNTDEQSVWKMFFVHTSPEQGYRLSLSVRNADYKLNLEWEKVKNNADELKKWLNSYKVQNIYDGRQVRIILNMKNVIETDNLTIINNGRTLVPLRAIFEALGASVDWNDETKTVTSSYKNTTITMTVGQDFFYKNGTRIPLDVAPQITNSRTLVPVRAVAEAFDCEIKWDGDSYIVHIFTK